MEYTTAHRADFPFSSSNWPATAANRTEFTFSSPALPTDLIRVYEFSGKEHLSQPFRFQVALISPDPDLDLDGPVGQTALLSMRGASGTRCIHGVIERFELTEAGRRQCRYEATLVPSIYPLRYTRTSRIFQGLSTPQIVRRVLEEGGMPSDYIREALRTRYAARDFCVQYQESDLDFIMRLMEEEGIFFFFEHREDREVMVLADSSAVLEPLATGAALPFWNRAPQPQGQREVMLGFRAESSIRPGSTVLKDFRFKHPDVDLEAKKRADSFRNLEMYYFPGEYVQPELGKRLASIRMEELRWDRHLFSGTSTSRQVAPGYRCRLEHHRRGAFNQEYLLVSVEHEGRQAQVLEEELDADSSGTTYTNRLTCIPATVPFRPHRVTPRPGIFGVQSAVVVGPGHEEIHCDEYGRVKVKFHWDRRQQRDDSCSCWVRVSQPWGGTGQGGIFIPRVGQEVLVQFLEGDPDRPVIAGRVYNGHNPVPHALPVSKTVSTLRSASSPGGNGFNELRFEDAAGREQIYLHAQHDFDVEVLNNKTEVVEGAIKETCEKTRCTTVKEDVTEDFRKKLTTTVGEDVTEIYKGKHTLEVRDPVTHTYRSTETRTIGGHFKETLQKGRTQEVSEGSTSAIKGPTEVTITGPATRTVVGGPDRQTINGSSFHTFNGPVTATYLGPHTVVNASGSAEIDPVKRCKVSSYVLEAVGLKMGGYGTSCAAHGAKIDSTVLKVDINCFSFKNTSAISRDIKLLDMKAITVGVYLNGLVILS